MAKITEQFRLMKEAYSDVCILFNENPVTLEPFDFFDIFVDFIDNYEVGCLRRACPIPRASLFRAFDVLMPAPLYPPHPCGA